MKSSFSVDLERRSGCFVFFEISSSSVSSALMEPAVIELLFLAMSCVAEETFSLSRCLSALFKNRNRCVSAVLGERWIEAVPLNPLEVTEWLQGDQVAHCLKSQTQVPAQEEAAATRVKTFTHRGILHVNLTPEQRQSKRGCRAHSFSSAEASSAVIKYCVCRFEGSD